MSDTTMTDTTGELPTDPDADGPDRRGRIPAGLRPRSWSLERTLTVVAVTMMPLGAVAIGLGWWGAANTPLLFEQIPYAISGGLLGAALFVAGGMLYLGSWVSRLAAQDREHADQLHELLREMRDELRSVRPVTAEAGTGSHNGPAPSFVVTPSGTMFHRPDCPVVADRDDVVGAAGDEDGLAPCGMCAPLA